MLVPQDLLEQLAQLVAQQDLPERLDLLVQLANKESQEIPVLPAQQEQKVLKAIREFKV
jgi:hypothetical protein